MISVLPAGLFKKLSSACFRLLPVLLLALVSAPAAHAGSGYTGNVDFGTVNVGQSGGSQVLTFTFGTPTALNVTKPVQVLTTGVANLDFKSDGSGSCAGSTYSTCTVSVVFSPTAPGLRMGAVVIEDTSGNVLFTAYIHGVGHGPQAGFNAGVMSAVGGAAADPNGLATDAAGNVYIADAQSETVYKVTPGGTATDVTPQTAYGPDGVAIDGAGNIYTAVGHFTYVTKTTPAGVTTQIGNVGFPAGMAVDGLGNLYIAEAGISAQSGNGAVAKLAPDGTQTTVGTGLTQPAGVAVDASGNVYIANTGAGTVVKVAPDSTQTTLVSGLFYPEGIAVDAAGNIYVTNLNNQLLEYSPTGTQLNSFATNQLSGPSAVALDSLGNIFVNSGSFTYEISRTPPTLGFLTSSVGTKSSDSPRSFTLENIGNDTLTIPVPAAGATNPTITTPDFTLDPATTCPMLTSASVSAGALASGLSCTYAVDFDPTTSGTLTSSLLLTDNSLNVTNATQTVPLNNQGTPVITYATVTVNDVFTNYTGAPVPATATTNPAGLAVSITYGPYGGPTTSTTPPTLPGLYSVSAVCIAPNCEGSGAGLIIINSPPAPVITWATPAPITVGTPLSATQLDATSTTAGTITYNIPVGTALAVGSYQITATLVPSDNSGVYPITTKTVTLVVQQNTQNVTPVNFGTVNVGTTSSTQTVTFTFINPVTLGATPAAVLTQGIAGLDFKNTNAGNCATGPYAASATCTVTVNFTPAVSGQRLGSVVLLDASGNILATAFIGGVGQGPQIVYDPGVKSVFAPNVSTYGLAIDAAGNTYLNELSDIVKVTPGGVQTTVASVSSGSGGVSGATAIDGAGNIYTLNLANSIVYEITPSGAQYQVGSGWVFPTDLAVDTAGNLYVTDRGYNPPPDTTGGRVSKVTAAGVQTTFGGPYASPDGVAVDGAGNVYVADNAGLGIINPGLIGRVYKINSSGAQTIFATGLFSPNSVAVDPAGNVFVTTASNNTSIDKITPGGVRTKLYDGQLSFPGVVRLAPSGDLYITQAVTGSQLVKFDRSTIPSLTFESTTINTTSLDSPQPVTVDNIGNATLNFAVPTTGTNASISANFSFAAATTCPRASHSSTLASGATCLYSVAFLPTTTGTIAGSITQTDNNLNVANAIQNIALNGTGAGATTIPATVMLGGLSQTYTGSPLSATATTNPSGLAVSLTYNGSATPPTAAGNYTVVGTVTTAGYTGSSTQTMVIAKATPVVTWATPAAVTYGTALSATQLDATASVGGTFVYTPALNATPAAGTDTLSVTFTPTDTTDYTSVTQTVNLVVNQATPVITWSTPAAITYGTALSATQLNATSSVAGMFVYTPAAGVVPTAGTDTLSVTFTPTDTTDYASVTQTVNLVVNQATPTVTWTAPAAITYGTALSATQLNATTSVGGTFAYTPAIGNIPNAGTDTLSVTFTPTDATDYTAVTQTVNLVVNQATPTVTWATPAAITYGTALNGTQLNATASVAGTFAYTPAAGAVPTAGTDTLSVKFTPTDAVNYAAVTQTVNLVVNKAMPTVTWATPAAITYGTALSAAQLNATASVAGTFVYTPAAGAIPLAGTDVLSVTFTPTDATDYSSVTTTVNLVVNKATPVVTWPTPAAIGYGIALSATQLDATASVAGTFVYTPAAGAVLNVGPTTLSVTFTPTDTTDYAPVTTTVNLVVTQPMPVITWANPAPITYGTALSATQLDATASVPGTFAYSPAAGNIPSAGTDMLSVTFTPTDTVNYSVATKTVSIVVNQATPTVTWPTPAAITYGTALSAAQLNATASVAGTFVYTPAAGAIPTKGTDVLSVTFTPTDAVDYASVTTTVNLVVNPATPTVTWPTPAPISYGTALSGAQLDATASVAGTFVYTPAAGAIPAAGNTTLSVTFTPTDTTDYASVTTTVSLMVTQPTPVITYAPPAAITYGTALSATQLDATASVAGTFSYSAALGSVPSAGTLMITATFMPTDTVDYSVAMKTVSLVVNQATPVITWATPSAISSGATLSATQLDATASVSGTFAYTPAAGSIPAAGTDTLSVTFTPTDAVDYTTATKTVSLVVNGAADFTFSVTGNQSQTITPPASATYTFALAPTQGSYPGAVTFTATGLPSGYSAMFSPPSLTAGSGAQTVTLTIGIFQSAMLKLSGRSYMPFAAGLLLLPLVGIRKLRRFRHKAGRYTCLLLMAFAGLAALAGVTGCGTSNGFFEQTGTTYNITVTATSASVQHSTTVQLTVK